MYNWDFYENLPDMHPIADANNLYEAYEKARKGSHWKTQAQRYRWNVLSETRKLQVELDQLQKGLSGGYKLSPYSRFIVNERGKTRAITALAMRDRVVKHVLNDVYLLPHIRPKLIYDNGASLKGKGVSFTRKRLIAHLESFYRETGSNDGYIMTMDFSGYYDNIDHEKAMEMICAYETDDFARLLARQAYDSYKIDVSYMTDYEYVQALHSKFSTVAYRAERHDASELTGRRFLHRSLSVGDQTSQITAIAFPTVIDKMVTIKCGCKYYARYMDDLYVIARTMDEVKALYDSIKAEAEKLKIFINPKKTHISRLSESFTFLQNKYYLADNGHVVVRINPRTVTRLRRKLKKLARLVQNGDTTLEKVESMFRSWIADHSKIMSNAQVSNLVALYRQLFGNSLDAWLAQRKLL